MKIFKVLISIVLLSLVIPSFVFANNFNYYNGSPTLSEVKEIMKFKVVEPTNLDKEDYLLSIKYHPDNKETAKSFTMHFISKESEEIILSITQSHKNLYEKEFSSDIEKVNINGRTGYFKKWGSDYDQKGKIDGGILWWEHKGTYIEMRSVKATKELMLITAKAIG